MDMRQVRHLIAVAEQGSMLRAAGAIHISQPALSKSIQNLEAELGVPLLERGPRGVTPTIYGEILLKHARLLRNQAEQALAEIRCVKDGGMGHLRLGVANFATYFLPRVVARLVESKPALSIEIEDGTYEGLTALLREGALDAVVSGFPPLHRADDLVHEELVSSEFLLLARAEHPLAQLDRVVFAELGGERWILTNRPRAIVDLFELASRVVGMGVPKLLVQSGSMIFIKAVLLEGNFLTLLPRGMAAEELASGRLVALPLDEPVAKTKEGIIYRAEAVHPPVLFALIEAIRAEERAGAEPGCAARREPHEVLLATVRRVTGGGARKGLGPAPRGARRGARARARRP